MAETPWSAGRLARGGGRPRILFGWSYEDERVELAAFGAPGRVLVIAASGETAAACAAAGHEVIAVDINPVQLDYARSRVAGGPTVTGTAERGMAVGRRALGLVAPAWRRPRVVAALTAPSSSVAAFWREDLDRRTFGLLLAGALRPGAAVAGLLRPEFARFVPARFDQALRARITAGLERHDGPGNRFAWRLLAGVDQPGWSLAAAPDDAISWVQGDVVAELERMPAGSLDGVSLSNVTDGAPVEFANRLQAAARRAVRPGGAIVSRSFAGDALATDDAALLWGRVCVERIPAL